jgi:hypothetical protein
MAMLRTSKFDQNESPSVRTYNWGTRGVEVTTSLLSRSRMSAQRKRTFLTSQVA